MTTKERRSRWLPIIVGAVVMVGAAGFALVWIPIGSPDAGPPVTCREAMAVMHLHQCVLGDPRTEASVPLWLSEVRCRHMQAYWNEKGGLCPAAFQWYLDCAAASAPDYNCRKCNPILKGLPLCQG